MSLISSATGPTWIRAPDPVFGGKSTLGRGGLLCPTEIAHPIFLVWPRYFGVWTVPCLDSLRLREHRLDVRFHVVLIHHTCVSGGDAPAAIDEKSVWHVLNAV